MIHRYTKTVIHARTMTLNGVVDGHTPDHVTLKDVIFRDILIDDKPEVLTSHFFLTMHLTIKN